MKKLLIIPFIIFFLSGTEKTTPLLVASFNIQFLGVKKISNPLVQNTVTKIISKFDVVAIQEIQDKTYIVVNTIAKRLKNYSYILGPNLGYSKRYKERYAYFFNKNKLTYIDHYTFNDKLDEFSREPLIVHFKTKTEPSIDLILITIHTPPKFAGREIGKLPKVICDAVEFYGTSNIIILGDFNADCAYYDERKYTKTFPESLYIWAIKNNMDTNVHTTFCTYDRIVLIKNLEKYYHNQAGVFRFDEIYKLTPEQTKAISDHYPVWINLQIK